MYELKTFMVDTEQVVWVANVKTEERDAAINMVNMLDTCNVPAAVFVDGNLLYCNDPYVKMAAQVHTDEPKEQNGKD